MLRDMNCLIPGCAGDFCMRSIAVELNVEENGQNDGK